jgi:amino acid adenylation domain-containing protein
LTQTPQVAVDIRFRDDEEGNLVLDIDHAREAVDRQVVRDILAALDRQIAAICERGAFEIIRGEMLDLGHYRLNGSEDDFACSRFLQRIADNLFTGNPDKPALICGVRRISYGELGTNVGKAVLALQQRGVGKGDVVAICLPRGPEHTAVTLACALLGTIWVPIDAASPPERLDYLLANCRPALVMAAGPVAGHDAATPEVLLAGEAPVDPQALLPTLDVLSASDEPAYYLYTSGTTGRPKCVVLSNRATSNVIGRTLENWQATESDVFISVTPLHHDMSIFDVFGCLTAGATLVQPAPGEEKDAIAWNRLVAEHKVSLWCSVPAILEMLLSCRQGDELRSLRLIAQGGDYIKPAVIAELRHLDPALRLVSLGGPTETTIWSIWHEIAPEDTGQVPYGRPLPGNRYFILNERGEHCPPGVVGRIHTAGVNVALGYLQDGVLGQNDFVTVTDEAGKPVRAFRTGDRGRYRHDGNILFASRVDGYVKVRGVRVSLPDIEAELGGHPDLRQLLVVDCGIEQRGEAEIGVIYVPVQAGKPSAIDLRAHARRVLPESHVPTRFVEVEALPLSANGKPDRRKARELLAATAERREPAAAKTAPPANSHSRKVLDLYLAVLGQPALPEIDDSTDFIRLGLLPSHLKSVASRIRDELNADLTSHQLLRCRNAGQVALLLRDQER